MNSPARESVCPLVASVLEIFVYHFILVYVWGVFDPRLESSPAVQQWFAWVPANLGFWLLNFCFALILAPPLLGISMFFADGVASRWPTRVTWKWTGAGRPPLLGSLLFVSLPYVLLVGYFLVVMNWD